MAELTLPVLFTLFAWWFSTGVILYLDGLPRHTFVWTLGGATALLGGALWALAHTRDDLSVAGAYCAFTCALLVWAWQEVAFLLGVVTGPRRTACPPGAIGWRRFHFALQAVLYHELALIVLAVAVLACVGDGTNRVGVWTYFALWAMRQSAKLNVFLGVRNLGESFLPEHLAYLKSYFQRRPMNVLFPISVTVATAAAVAVWWRLIDGGAGAHDTAALALVGTLVALGALEHWLLVLPLPTEALWRWGLRSHRPDVLDPAQPAARVATPPV
ncbi:putative photosynthetic complex assembly protein PuhE [Ideonella sp. A 288]|uniref:putative photosynthetic complex assembly protein PuhE n=1 Tax=Ideonella sp. A 288 TaxID=1962181 RepID=UPI000B4B2CE9|nr:putative photosynthetic complex assembly protein PuhE [Ideonella sp. A 288]